MVKVVLFSFYVKLNLNTERIAFMPLSMFNFCISVNTSWMSRAYLRIFSFVWLGLTKVSQAAAGRNLWIEPSKYPRNISYRAIK